MAIEGGCRCGEVRYEILRETMPLTYACHCHQCQRWSGSAFSQNASIAEDSLRVTGPIASFEIVTGDRISTQRACERCHTRIYNTNTRRPGSAFVRAGTIDRSDDLACIAHIYTAYKQAWLVLPDDVPAWAEAAPSDELAALLESRS